MDSRLARKLAGYRLDLRRDPFYSDTKREEHKADITGVKVADDNQSADLIIEGRHPNYVYHTRIDAMSEKGEKI